MDPFSISKSIWVTQCGLHWNFLFRLQKISLLLPTYRCIFPNFDHFLQLRFVKLTTTYMCINSRTYQDMDGALHTDFANFYTIWGSTTKISALLQLRKKWILTKFEGCGSKNGQKMSKTSNGCGRSIFWAIPFKFGENSFLF